MKKLYIIIYIMLSACIDTQSAKEKSTSLLHDLGITVDRVHCETTFMNEHASCSAKTMDDKVYTIDCDWNRCVLVRGPGQ